MTRYDWGWHSMTGTERAVLAVMVVLAVVCVGELL